MLNIRKISKRVLRSSPATFGRLMGLYPPFWFMGVRVRFSEDYLVADIRLPRRWYLRNGHGTVFGGAILSASDPFPAIQFAKLMPWALTWTKSHSVDFIRPARSVLTATVRISRADVEAAEAALRDEGRYKSSHTYVFTDKWGQTVAQVESTVYMRNPRHTRYRSAA